MTSDNLPAASGNETGDMKTVKQTFKYFGFGSNLLEERIKIRNPSAVRLGTGRLENYRLDFGYTPTSRWNGSPATIVPDEGKHVWGAIWEIDADQMENLDKQEGVDTGVYFPLTAAIEMSNLDNISCRAYQLVNNPVREEAGGKPSKTYLGVIVAGSIQSQLPDEYTQQLKAVEHNGQLASSEILEQLGKSYEVYVD